MNMTRNNRKTNSLAVLLLFGVLAVCLLFVLLTGADAYRRLSSRDSLSYDRRTAGQYLSTRVRQADRAGQVRVDSFGGADALVFSEEIDGVEYETLVYCYDGALRELFAAADGDFLPEDGEQILRADSLSLSLEGSLLTARLVSPEGETQELTLLLRSGKGDTP